ncbi:MAG: hypothetical protein CXR30_14900 [Geobacter sp.]|nr:MAG: hypothetical protein CXR30_14900 [Geobacter sp.]
MEIFGGFMVMMSILSFFMAVVWFVMPFVVFAIKGKLDRTLDVLTDVEKRMAKLEARMEILQSQQNVGAPKPREDAPATAGSEQPPLPLA